MCNYRFQATLKLVDYYTWLYHEKLMFGHYGA